METLNLETIKDYIIKNFPDTLWWDGIHKHTIWVYTQSFKHRQGLPNEIRIEFDGEDLNENWMNINITAINLYNAGYNFAIFSVEGGRSPHLHIYDLDELEQLTIEQRERFRKLFLNKYCPKDSTPDLGLCDEKHLCALEFVPHFKHKNPKRLLGTFKPSIRNIGIDFDLKMKVLDTKEKKQAVKSTFDQSKLKFGDKLKMQKRDAIIQKLNFETVLDKYGVKYRGYMAVCPFHNDTNGSLSFNNEKGLWNCFGCQAKGDIITLIKMLKERENGESS